MTIAQVARVVYHRVAIGRFLDQLKAAVAATGELNLATVHLYTGPDNPTPNTSEADLTEVLVADWAEYLSIATTGWGAKETRADGSVMMVATPLLSWTGPAAGSGPTVKGAYLKSAGAGTPYICCMPFTAPVGMTDATKVLTLALPFAMAGGPFSI